MKTLRLVLSIFFLSGFMYLGFNALHTLQEPPQAQAQASGADLQLMEGTLQLALLRNYPCQWAILQEGKRNCFQCPVIKHRSL